MNWTDPHPVFFDFETQSAADLRKVGGRRYAADPSTRVLSLVTLIDGVCHVRTPTYLSDGLQRIDAERLHPAGHARLPITLYLTSELPGPIREAADAGRTFVGHNCLGFDRFVWRAKVGGREPGWADTVFLARSAGYPGTLDAFGGATGSGRKDDGGRFLSQLMTAGYHGGDLYYPPVKVRNGVAASAAFPVGTYEAVLRYNVADVRLLAAVWRNMEDHPVEADVIDAHDAVNERGLLVDRPLLRKLSAISAASVSRAADEIERRTGGVFHAGNTCSSTTRRTPAVGVRPASRSTTCPGRRRGSTWRRWSKGTPPPAISNNPRTV